MNDNKNQYPKRKNIRLENYDYSQAGLYFVTICTKNRIKLFGNIENGNIMLNDAGKMIKKWWVELKNKFKNIELHEFIIMPNHIHGIIEIKSIRRGRPACLPVRPACLPENDTDKCRTGEHTGSPLHRMIQWFKTMTTNEYIKNVKQNKWIPFDKKLWQRNYYEHIIRNEISYLKIAEYIINNPLKWEDDKYYV